MELPSAGLIEILAFLLPGFVTAAVYFALTPAPRPAPFERVVQALIFTMVVQAVLFVLRGLLLWIGRMVAVGTWTADVQLVWSVIIGLSMGFALTWTSNRDRLHAVLRRAGITDQTSFASEWYGALCKNKGYIVLHLKGSRRLYGWAEEWPSVPERGHFVMARAEWLDDGASIPLTGVDRILVRADEVEMVELMTVSTKPPGDEYGRSESADAAATAALEDGLA